MSRISYVNGRYLAHRDAQVHIEDRGYQFADGIYEVVAVAGGNMVDAEWHLDRMAYSLGELAIPPAVSRSTLLFILREIVRRNRLNYGLVYLQSTRGVAPRNHIYGADIASTLVISARNLSPPNAEAILIGASVITIPDIRWGRCDIKSVALLPNVMGKQAAAAVGAVEAWLIDEDGLITEGTSSNAWIINDAGEILTRPTGNAILAGITRRAVIQLAEQEQLSLVERPFSVAEATAAKEAFLTSSSAFVKPITRINESPISDGQPGPLTRRLLNIYLDHMEKIASGADHG